MSRRVQTTWRSALASAVASTVLASTVGVAVADPLASSSALAEASALATKKGVDAWTFDGVDTALADSRASWYLNWSTSPGSIVSPARVRFVPMIRGSANVTAASLVEAKRYGPYLLTFNEPDLGSQANMTVAQALALWPRLEAAGLELASPAVAYGADRPGGWLDRFMRGAVARDYRVNFIALHWYGADFRTSAAVSQLRTYLLAVHDRYPTEPIWLTEYSLINFGSGAEFPTAAQQGAFVSASITMLDRLPFLARFAWYALPTSGVQSTGLFSSRAIPTAAGRAFSAAP